MRGGRFRQMDVGSLRIAARNCVFVCLCVCVSPCRTIVWACGRNLCTVGSSGSHPQKGRRDVAAGVTTDHEDVAISVPLSYPSWYRLFCFKFLRGERRCVYAVDVTNKIQSSSFCIILTTLDGMSKPARGPRYVSQHVESPIRFTDCCSLPDLISVYWKGG